MKKAAIIVAAGRGSRAGPGAPKQYRLLAGEPVLRRTLAAFCRHPKIDTVLAVIHPDDIAAYQEAASGLPKLLSPIFGGDTRQASVLAGLEALKSEQPDLVLIHDGARPLLSAQIISRCIDALQTSPGVQVGIPLVDTIRHVSSGLAGDTIPREGIWRAQTPQAFHYQAILDAHRQSIDTNHTDDVAIATACGIHVRMVEGSEDNIKITTASDLHHAEQISRMKQETRTGMGFDVHRFGPGDHVWLCGIRIPHEHGLVGHSDADVGLHALTDAILGALASGDIGQHFPPSDPQWKGASSDIFLAHAGKLALERGARITSLDLTLICEKPKIGPHSVAMRERVASILSLDIERISIKATTTEGLGFTGRGEGIAGQAIATLVFS